MSASPALGGAPELEIRDCPALNPTITRELLAIELGTLGIAPSTALAWTIRCHGPAATLELRKAPSAAPATDTFRPDVTPLSYADGAVVEIDLSTTDEAAWPRLLAIAASELVEQSQRSSPTAPPPKHAFLPRIRAVAFAVKTTQGILYQPFVAFTLTRLGEPATWLKGLTLGAELHLTNGAFFGTDLRAQWGDSAIPHANITWQLVSVAAFGGVGKDLGPLGFGVLAGMRLGRLALTAETQTVELSGRSLLGPTGGPFVTIRWRTSLGRGLFIAANAEAGYSILPVRGNDDQMAPLLRVDGVWTGAGLGLYRAF